jgi:hypothetical protein
LFHPGCQIKSDSGACQVGTEETTFVLGRIKYETLWQSILGESVVISDNHPPPESFDVFYFRFVGYPTIHCNNEEILLSEQLVLLSEPGCVEAIPFSKAIGDMPRYPRSKFL